MESSYIIYNRRRYDKYWSRPNDCGILVNIPLEIEGIEVSIFLRKYKEEIRVSLRSKHINVNEIVKYLVVEAILMLLV